MRLHRGTVTLKYHVSTNILLILIWWEIFRLKSPFVLLNQFVRIQTIYLINNKHEEWNFINLIDLILNKCTNYTNLFINVWNERETIRFINFIVLFIRRKSNFVTCLSLDNNFESSTLFALFPDFPTCPIVPIIYGFTHKLKGTSNYTPFYPARGTVDTLGCTWNARSVFTKLNCVALKILHL